MRKLWASQPEDQAGSCKSGLADAQNINRRIPKCGQIAFGLIFLSSQRGMKATQDQIEALKGPFLHVPLAIRRQVQFDRTENT